MGEKLDSGTEKKFGSVEKQKFYNVINLLTRSKIIRINETVINTAEDIESGKSIIITFYYGTAVLYNCVSYEDEFVEFVIVTCFNASISITRTKLFYYYSILIVISLIYGLA